ncbi:hypothetical protein GWI33_017507 [Rhynchophorus ferrugineus]|uniref:Uncharacterized protein n=1 Tax=Rhynchophorus ferrugineus TaxID=354439 RepID=A0A834M2C9_RHYFE|nr:hypothetical protein GWI33_017507 [Rhynchophorus ferrugineus]
MLFNVNAYAQSVPSPFLSFPNAPLTLFHDGYMREFAAVGEPYKILSSGPATFSRQIALHQAPSPPSRTKTRDQPR